MILSDAQLDDYWDFMDGYWQSIMRPRVTNWGANKNNWLPTAWAATCNVGTRHVHVDQQYAQYVRGHVHDRPPESTCLCDAWRYGDANQDADQTWLLTFEASVYGELFDPAGEVTEWSEDLWYPEALLIHVPGVGSDRWEFTAWHSFENTFVEFSFNRGSRVALDEQPAVIGENPIIRGALAVLFTACR